MTTIPSMAGINTDSNRSFSGITCIQSLYIQATYMEEMRNCVDNKEHSIVIKKTNKYIVKYLSEHIGWYHTKYRSSTHIQCIYSYSSNAFMYWHYSNYFYYWILYVYKEVLASNVNNAITSPNNIKWTLLRHLNNKWKCFTIIRSHVFLLITLKPKHVVLFFVSETFFSLSVYVPIFMVRWSYSHRNYC